MRRLVRALIALVLSSVAFPSSAVVWFGDEDGVHRVNTDTNRADLRINSSEPVALGFNASDGSVWSLTRTRITKYNAAGASVFSRSLSSYSDSIGNGRHLALNAANGSAWIAGERRLLHVSATGSLLSATWSDATDMAVAQDGTLWLLDEGDNEIRRYANEGGLIGRTNLSGVSRESRYIALDDTRGVFWLGGERSLVKRSLANPSTVLKTVTVSDDVSSLSLDVQTGEVWVLARNSFHGYRPDGSRFVSEYVGNDGVSDPETLAFDIGTGAIWIGHRKGLTRFTRTGHKVATIPADEVDTVAVSRAAIVIEGRIDVVSPVPNATLTNPRPTIVFQFSADCSGSPCGFPPSYFSNYSVNATIDGVAIAPQLFVFDPATAQTRYTLTTPLSQGLHDLRGQVVDGSGRAGGTTNAFFTIDSIGPQFGPVTPASGSVFTTPQITIAGSTNDPAARVTLSGVAADQPSTFSFPVTLALGVNNFTLTATDVAGNATPLSLTYTFDVPNVLPVVSITAPGDGANFAAPASFAVTANATDPDGTILRVDFFSNGNPIGSDTSAPFAANVANLATGTYVLTAVATDNRNGATTSAPVTVTVGPANALPTVTLLLPRPGTSLSAPATVTLRATAADTDGTIDHVDFLRNGVVIATIPGPGPIFESSSAGLIDGQYDFAARAVDDRGGSTTTPTARVAVSSPLFTLDSPAQGQIIDGDSVVVRGLYGPLGSGVSVNGQSASLVPGGPFSGTYTALVPLIEGTNTITAKITTPDGATATRAISVVSTRSSFPFDVTVEPTSGFAPLTVTFTLTNLLPDPVEIFFNGSFLGAIPGEGTAAIPPQFPPGIHVVTLGAAAGGAQSQRQYVIESIDRNVLDQQLRQMWADMNTALLAGDRDKALTYLSSGAREKYGPVFDKLMPNMPAIIASYSPLQRYSLTTTLGEYAVNRTIDGVNRLFLVYFTRGEDGAWRIDAM